MFFYAPELYMEKTSENYSCGAQKNSLTPPPLFVTLQNVKKGPQK